MAVDYQSIIYDVGDGVATITINRPERRNALSLAAVNEIVHALESARDDDAVRVVVITGAGKGFSAGGDLGQMAGGGAGGTGEGVPFRGGFVEMNLLLTRLGKPTVARVNGHAMGGGLGIVVACDFAVASEKAKMATPEINVGLFPMMIMANIFRNVPRKKGLELIMLGERITAKEAEAIGLITRAVPHEELDEAVRTLVDKLKSKSPITLKLGLNAFYRQQDLALEEALPFLQAQLGECMGTQDFLEGVSAFLQKRDPVWKGK